MVFNSNDILNDNPEISFEQSQNGSYIHFGLFRVFHRRFSGDFRNAVLTNQKQAYENQTFVINESSEMEFAEKDIKRFF